jgi:hypothetical protein
MYNITSLERLRRAQLPKTWASAQSYLYHRLDTTQILTIYQSFFPNEFPDIWMLDQEKLLPKDENSYSEAELACFKLIEERLFPFAHEYLMMCADEGERLSTIPLYPYGMDLWNRPLSDFDPGWLILIALFEPQLLELDGPEASIIGQAKRPPTGGFPLAHLDSLCQKQEEPLRYLPLALLRLDHATENAFLDTTDEMPCEDMSWCEQDVALLAAHWKRAQTIMDQTDALAQWCASDLQHLRKVVDLWNQAIQEAE